MASSNSSIKLQDIVLDAKLNADLNPVLSTSAGVDLSLSIANDVMTAMVQGGPNGEPMNPKWNRILSPQYGQAGSYQFPTISWQQDYAQNIVNLGWVERSWMIDINSTSNPKRKLQMEVRRELGESYLPGSVQGQICAMQNQQMQFGVWGQSQIASQQGILNPGPNVVYTKPVGTAGLTPSNPTTQIVDSNGNYWVLTTFGTCGSSQPSWPASPVFPTPTNPAQAPTTQADGTCVWTAINPQAYGFRINPIPSQSSVVWLILPILQAAPKRFATLAQTLDPIPDMYSTYFKNGFFIQCGMRSSDPKKRASYTSQWPQWMKSLDLAVKAGLRESDEFGFYPERSIMDAGGSAVNYGAAWPYPGRPFGS